MRLCLCWPFANVAFAFLIYLSICPFFPRATNADSAVHADHNHHRLLGLLDRSETSPHEQNRDSSYEPSFAGMDRGIIGRAPQAVTALANNAPQPMNIEPGDTQYWTFPKSSLQAPPVRPIFPLPLDLNSTMNNTRLEGDLRQLAEKQSTMANTRNVWISISVCDQPTSAALGTAGVPPQLEVYLSQSASNQQPGPNDQPITVEGGYGNRTLTDVSDDIFIGVRAPQAPDGFEGIYNYELAASIDAPYITYFNVIDNTQITAWDTDSNSSILSTGDITNSLSNSPIFERWMTMDPPFNVYVHNLADLSFRNLNRSICGLKNHAKVKESEKRMVKIGGQPKQLFYVNGLDSTASYSAIMTWEPKQGNSTAGGGGAVWKAANFTTKSDNNCQIIHNLPFCQDVAYAVPSNPNRKPNSTDLGLLYDGWANEFYQNFSKSLQQIPCNTTDSARYSLAKNCTDCDNAYKAWLCAVTIPRCEDFSASPDKRHLLARNINQKFINGSAPPNEGEGKLFSAKNKSMVYHNVSRNGKIDAEIQPGPYKEMLPCKELCYHLTQNCPAALQFACPPLESKWLNFSYGHHQQGDKEWFCNWPGGPNLLNGAGTLGVGWWLMGIVAAAAMYVL